MKPSEKTSAKTKGPRVLANIIKKHDGSNSSINRSFFNKTSNRYVSDLRNNNAKLAHGLAKEKAKTAEFFRRFTQSEALLMSHQSLLRYAFKAVQSGLRKFNDSIDLMVEGSRFLGELNEKIVSFCPELEDPPKPPSVNGTCAPSLNPQRMSANDDTSVTPNSLSNGVRSEEGQLPPTTTVSTMRQCTAKPMVKGQVISKPTISLQRVNVPSRHLGQNMMNPTRGVDVYSTSTNDPSRLSNIFEQVDESDVSIPSQLTVSPGRRSENSSPSYEPCTSKSLPSSHVVLQRIPSDYVCASVDLSPHQRCEDEDQLTVVHFGSLNFHNSPHKRKSYPPKKSATPKGCSKEKKGYSSPDISKSAFNSSNSEENDTESSSEDEDLALQIVECKRSYLDRKRQVDSKEGTSWNYDEAGKFRERPPKRKRSTKPVQGITPLSSRDPKAPKRNLEDRWSNSRELRGKPSVEQQIVTKPPSEENICSTIISPKVSNKCPDSAPSTILNYEPMNATVLDEMDMSFTCVSTDRTVVSQLSKTSCRNNEEKKLKTSENPPFSERIVYVTQRTRSKKSSPEKSRSPELHHRSPVSSPLNRKTGSGVENNENSPPDHALCSGLSRLPNVVLERLPSNVYSSLQLADGVFDGCKILQSPRSSAVEKAIEPTESLRSPSKKRVALRSSKPEKDVPDEIQSKPKSDRGPKGKERKKQAKVHRSLEGPSTSATSQCVSSLSAPSSPTHSSNTVDLTDEGHNHRQRRNITPASYKEPPCNRKMRRP